MKLFVSYTLFDKKNSVSAFLTCKLVPYLFFMYFCALK